MKAVFVALFVLATIINVGCSDSTDPSAPSESATQSPFQAEFVKMEEDQILGISLPLIRVTNTSDKDIYAIIVKYECYDEAGNVLPHDHASGALVSGTHESGGQVRGLFRPGTPHEVNFGLNESWIPKGTSKVTVSPQWAQYMDDETWGDNTEFTQE